ncbi:MAG TPA: transketolase C-terminal domain-containing protein [Candidatus Saccharimonadales bacterium]|nr:transketolase C-terminal domain-containing protein [Candidatus Saccharimonadales bacterium]
MTTTTTANAKPKFELKMGVATREAYGQALVELGKKDPNVIVLDADLAKSTFSAKFQKEFPDRFFTVGIAEANMVGIASGLALSGKLPFASSFAVFLCDKGYDQLRMCVAYPGVNAKFVGSHGGISIGEDGPSQQSVEDYALMCALAGFVVLSPSDEFCARALVHRMAEHVGPVYMRTGRAKAPIIYGPGDTFEIGKAKQHGDGRDAAIVACGFEVGYALHAQAQLAEEGIQVRVLDMHTIKPIDEAAIAQAAKECGAIVSAEEHLLDGGLGSQVARAVTKTHPVPMEFIGVQNTYAESATPEQLMEKYGLTAPFIVAAVKAVLKRK